LASSAYGRPNANPTPEPEPVAQYSYPRPTGYPDISAGYLPPCSAPGGARPTATCTRRQTGPGAYDFVCEVSDECAITIQREDILWLKAEGKDETINVVVPNYKLEEVIKAAFKSGPGAKTGVNILLKRPEYSVVAEVDETQSPREAPNVNLEYEPIPQREVVHYPTNQQYRPLSGPILEPGASQRQRY